MTEKLERLFTALTETLEAPRREVKFDDDMHFVVFGTPHVRLPKNVSELVWESHAGQRLYDLARKHGLGVWVSGGDTMDLLPFPSINEGSAEAVETTRKS